MLFHQITKQIYSPGKAMKYVLKYFKNYIFRLLIKQHEKLTIRSNLVLLANILSLIHNISQYPPIIKWIQFKDYL